MYTAVMDKTPFERLKEATKQILSVPKKDLPKKKPKASK